MRRTSVRQLCASISEFGFLVPILVDERCSVIAGHGRLAAAQQLGLNQVPVVRIAHLSVEQKRAYLLADNRLAELSGWDMDILKIELEELSALNLAFDFEITGFDTVDIDRLRETPKKVADDPDDHLSLPSYQCHARETYGLSDRTVSCVATPANRVPMNAYSALPPRTWCLPIHPTTCQSKAM